MSVIRQTLQRVVRDGELNECYLVLSYQNDIKSSWRYQGIVRDGGHWVFTRSYAFVG